jgi:hypothetical protein
MKKLLLSLLVVLLSSCKQDLITMEIQLLKINQKDTDIGLVYGSQAGFKNSQQRNLPIFNHEKISRDVINRSNIYIYINDNFDFRLRLYKDNNLCGSYILKYNEGSVDNSDSTGKSRVFIVQCKPTK